VLNTYIAQTQRLLQNPVPSTPLYATSDLTAYINTARGQIAGEAQCIRTIGQIPTVVDQRPYAFSAIDVTFATVGIHGIQGVLSIDNILTGIGTGMQWFRSRPWPWFLLYKLNNANPQEGPPSEWAQIGQGASGVFYLDPLPDSVYTLYVDSVCYHVALVDDTTAEALPYLWTDAVPYFAAYMAYMSSQRTQDADAMYSKFKEFMARARAAATPEVLAPNYSQGPDPVAANRLGIRSGGGQ